MTIRKAAFVCLLVISPPSCQAMMYGTAEKLNDISVGMHKSEAVDRLGRPDSTYASDGAEFLIYKWMKTVIDWAPKYFYVKIVGGLVDSYGEQKSLQVKHEQN